MKKKSIIVLIVLMVIGFAAVSTTLYINGTATIGANDDDFIVEFTKAVIDEVDKSTTAIDQADKQKLTFTTKTLKIVGEKSRLEFEVKNNSKNYDATIVFECALVEAEHSDYYRITEELPKTIKAGNTVSGKVEIELIKSSIEEFDEKFQCTINASAVELTSNEAVANKDDNKIKVEIVNGDSLNQLGTEVQIKGENFYVIKSENDNLTLLSKYNLQVTEDGIQESQAADAISYNLPFSKTAYWKTECASSYKSCNLNELTDTDDATVLKAAEEYASLLGSGVTGRLLTKEEVEELVTVPENIETVGFSEITAKDGDDAMLNIINGSYKGNGGFSYWLGSAFDNNTIWFIDGALSSMGEEDYDNEEDIFGIRPVIEISKDIIVGN